MRQVQLSTTSFMSVSTDGTMEVWDLLSGDKVMTVRPNLDEVEKQGTQARLLAAQFDRHQLVAAFSHGEIKRWVLLSEN